MRQGLLELGPGQGGPHAEVDAGAEGHLGGAPLLGDVEDLGLLPRFGIPVGPGE